MKCILYLYVDIYTFFAIIQSFLQEISRYTRFKRVFGEETMIKMSQISFFHHFESGYAKILRLYMMEKIEVSNFVTYNFFPIRGP